MSIFRRPTNNTHIYDENRSALAGELQHRITSGRAGKTHGLTENAIFVDDFRYPRAPGRGGPVETGRARFYGYVDPQ